MKNNILYKFLVISVFFIFIILSGIQKVYANSSFAIWGYIKDNEGNAKEGITISVVGTSYTATTDSEGYYEIKGLGQGNYTLEYDYENSGNIYNTESAQMYQLDKYTDKLEIAFVHSEEENIENYVKQIKNIVEEKASGATNSPRILDLKYSDRATLIQTIKDLRSDTDYEKAFHKAHSDGWKSMATIFYTQAIRYQNSHIEPLEENNDYDIVIKTHEANNEDFFIKGIYKNLMQTEAQQENIEFTDNNNKMKLNVELSKNTMLNIKLKRSTSGLVLDDSYDGFIKGNITLNDTLIQENLKVTLVKDTGEKITRTTANGEYKFGYPGTGKYRIEFSFDTQNINGQNYEVIHDYTNINDTTNPTQNCIDYNNTNIEQLKNKFNKIGYREERILDNNPEECALEGYSDWFYINGTNSKKNGGIVLQEREKFGLELKTEMTAFKIVLGDGQTLADWSKGTNQNINNVLTTNSSGAFVITMDNEIRFGSTLYAEYNISVKNNRNIKCNEFTIVNGSDLLYNSEEHLLTDSNTKNSDNDWQGIERIEEYVSNTLDSSLQKTNYLKLTDNSGLQPGEEKTYKIVLSKILDADCTYANVVEIVEYINSEGRRNYNLEGENIEAGNYWNEGVSEADTGVSQALLIMPPFGGNKRKIILTIFLIILLVINYFIFNIKKNKRRKH